MAADPLGGNINHVEDALEGKVPSPEASGECEDPCGGCEPEPEDPCGGCEPEPEDPCGGCEPEPEDPCGCREPETEDPCGCRGPECEVASGPEMPSGSGGVETPETGPLQTRVFEVGGMDCASCARTLEAQLRKTPGVSTASVNYSSARMKVAFDPSIVGVDRLMARLSELGHPSISLEGASAPVSSQDVPWFRETRVLLAGAAALATGIGGVIHLLEPGGWLSRAFFAIAIASAGTPMAVRAWRSLKHLVLDMNVLMGIAVTGAVLIGEWMEAATVTVLFLVSQVLEGRSMERARRAIRGLIQGAPRDAWVKRDSTVARVPVDAVRLEEIIVVRPGARVPLDGEVISGRSSINQAVITGESMPVERGPGDTVFAGSLNQEGLLEVRVTRLSNDTTLARIIHSVEEAQEKRAPTSQFIDRFARVYTPVVIGLAVLVAFAIPLILHVPFQPWVYRALVLLVIACPCALVISTPVSIVSGLAAAARNGVLIKGGLYLEALGRLKALAFDKTGTLTRGCPVVTDVVASDGDRAALLAQAASVEAGSEHPLAKAIVAAARKGGINLLPVKAFQETPGQGATGVVDGRRLWVGKPHWLDEECRRAERLEVEGERVVAPSQPSPEERPARTSGAGEGGRFARTSGAGEGESPARASEAGEGESPARASEAGEGESPARASEAAGGGMDLEAEATRLRASGKTLVAVGDARGSRGLLAIADELRPDARGVIARVKSLGIDAVAMVTGDTPQTAAAIGASAGVTEIHAQLLPEDKVREVTAMREREGVVAMVGDGVNDAPAMAASSLGIAMGAAGNDTALEVADMALMEDRLVRLPFAIELGRQTLRVIRQNIAVSLGVKALFLALAMSGMATLWMAIVADMGVSLLVTFNGLRLLVLRPAPLA